MKKIIAALSVTALALTAAFADVSLEFTQKADLFGDNGVLKYTGYAKNKGCLKFTLKNDYAGVQLDVDPTVYKPGDTDSTGAAVTDETTKEIVFDHYYGWTNFFDGAFSLQSGVWETRSVNRMNKDAGKWEGGQYEKNKYGVVGGAVAKDINNISTINGVKKLATQLAYKGDGLYAEALIVDSAYDSTSGLDPKAGWAVEAGMNIGEGSKLTVDFKNPEKDAYAVGAFFENKTLKENLDFVVGFSFGRNNNAAKDIEWAIDARARYDLTDNMALVSMNNLSYLGKNKDYSIWDMLSLTVNASEKIKVLMTAEWYHSNLLNKNNVANNAQGNLDLIPSVTYTAVKGVDMSAGLIIHTYGWSEPSTSTFEVPFILHVAL